MPYFIMLEYPELAEQGACFIDIWPFQSPIMATYHPDLAAQFTTVTSLPKHEIFDTEFLPFTGRKDLVTSEGEYWKKWRSVFNPGFSHSNITALVPRFIQETVPWISILDEAAQNGLPIRLETSVMRMTCDLIGRSVLGVSLGCQPKGTAAAESEIFTALKRAISLIVTDWSPPQIPKQLNPLRLLRMRWWNRVLRKALTPLIVEQLVRADSSGGGPKTVSGLAIQSYRKEHSNNGKDVDSDETIDSDFLDAIVQNLRIFLFAGHDTTSSTLCFAYYYLHRHPGYLIKLRKEHDGVFGPDPTLASSRIASEPALLNKLPYTMAVLKETLRLEPPAASVRQSSRGFLLRLPKTGQLVPAEGFMLLSSSKSIHRNPEFWSEPDRFMPERWIDGSSIARNAFRPFELGPRSCIGQELVMTELKMLLVLTVRIFEIVPTYGGSDPTCLGHQAYQASLPGELTPHPTKGLPVVVKRRKCNINQDL